MRIEHSAGTWYLNLSKIFFFFVFCLVSNGVNAQEKNVQTNNSKKHKSALTISKDFSEKVPRKSQNRIPKNKGNISSSNSNAQEVSPFISMRGKNEVLSLRDESSRTYDNGDGTFVALIGAGPIHYKKNGKWEEIDTNIKNVGLGQYSYSNTENSLKSYYGGNSNVGVKSVIEEGELVEFVNTSMYWEKNGVAVNKKLNAGVPATIQGDELFYKNLYGSISAEFKTLTGKRKLTYVIPNKESLGDIPIGAEYLVFTEDIILQQGWKYELKENKVWIKDSKDEILFLYHAPIVFEQYLSADSFKLTRDKPTVLEVKQSGNTLTYILKVKKDWLLDENRMYPLGIDPTLSYPKNEAYSSGSADASGFGVDDLIAIGYLIGDEIDGYVRFDLSAIPAGSTITATTSGIYRYDDQGGMDDNRFYRSGSSNFDPRHWFIYQAMGWFDDFYYLDIFNSYTGNLTLSPSTAFSGNDQFKTNTFDATGRTYVQTSLPNGYVNVIFYPIGSDWNTTGNNYGFFRGYSAAAAQKPYLSITYTAACSASTSTSSNRYINNVKFLGTLNPDTNNSSVYTATGYADYKSLPDKAKQIPGGGINVFVSNVGSGAEPINFIKAWVDWNNDNIFDPATEEVYDSGDVLTSSTTFGYIVPVGTAPGNYNIRIRTYYYDSMLDDYGYYFGPCGSRPNGETEDYSFTVIADCAAKITAVNIDESHGHRCGAGAVTVSATGTGTSYRWYTTEFGGTAIPGAINSTYTTGTLAVGNYTYYVTSLNGTCESVKRTPVKVVVSPTPEVTFSISDPSICGDVESLLVNSSGDKEEITIFNENFESGLGLFSSASLINNGATVNAATAWQNKISTFIPTGAVWFPAINSGAISNRFAYATSDILPPSMPGYSINTTLTYSSTVINTTDFLNLTLSFDAYYSYFGTTGEGLYVEVSADGTTWEVAETYTSNIGIGTRFENKLVDLSDYIDQPNLRLRFRYNAGWADGVAIDNVKLFGEKPLETDFDWTGPAVIFDENCIDPYTGASTTVCIKPTDVENNESWSITATATLSNGCSATGTIEVENNNKVWNSVFTNWATLNWKPGTAVPTADDCVIIRTPVNIPSATDALAKNLKVDTGGNLTIQSGGALTVTDYINNTLGATNFVVESDANLLQVNPVDNTGEITVKRAANVAYNQYNYWASPVKDQLLYELYDNIPINRVMTYNTWDDYFTILPSNSFPESDFGIGYSIKGPSSGGPAVTAEFVGVPQNESLTSSNTIQLSYVGAGYNLIGNPFPSNLNIKALHDDLANMGKFDDHTYYFWDNTNNTVLNQQGSGYNGNSYASYNASTGVGTKADTNNGDVVLKPNGIVKPGQGFLVKAKSGESGGLIVKNTMRTKELKINSGDENAPYYKNGSSSETESKPRNDVFWLELVNPNDLNIQIAIAYRDMAENIYDRFDTPLVNGSASDNVYSLSKDAHKLTIQGRQGPFENSDVIPLGVKFFFNGKYKIQLEDRQGIFKNHQNIYLKDKYLDQIHNLSESFYDFEGTVGEFTDRFEILFKKPESTASDDAFANKNKVLIQKINNQIAISSEKEKIFSVEIFNLVGWSVYKNEKVQANELRVPAAQFGKEIIVVKVLTETGEIVTKKIINK